MQFGNVSMLYLLAHVYAFSLFNDGVNSKYLFKKRSGNCSSVFQKSQQVNERLDWVMKQHDKPVYFVGHPYASDAHIP